MDNIKFVKERFGRVREQVEQVEHLEAIMRTSRFDDPRPCPGRRKNCGNQYQSLKNFSTARKWNENRA